MAGTTTPKPEENGFEEPAEQEIEEMVAEAADDRDDVLEDTAASSEESEGSAEEASLDLDSAQVPAEEGLQNADEIRSQESLQVQEANIIEVEAGESDSSAPEDEDLVDQAFVPEKQPRNHSVSPAPIPVLDRPPSNPNAEVSISSINAMYEDETTSASDAVDDDVTRVIPRVEPESADIQDAGTQDAGVYEPATSALPAAGRDSDAVNSPTSKPGASRLDAAEASESVTIEPISEANNMDTEQEPFAGFDEEKSGRGWVKGLVGTCAALLLVGGAYAGAQYYFADKIAKDVDVAGVSIAGLTEADAAAKLETELSGRISEPMTLAAAELQTEVVPSELGFTLDSEKTVQGLTGFTWDPIDLWEHLTGAADVEPVLTVDEKKFATGIAPVESALYVEPINGTVSFIDGEAVATEAVDGMGVTLEDASTLISSNLFNDTRPVIVEPQPIAPDITQEATDAGLASAKKIASAAVTVEVGEQKAEIPQEAFTSDIEVTYENGAIGFVFDGKKLSKEVLDRTNDLVRETQDAYFTFSGGKPSIVPEVNGTALDADTLAKDFAAAAQSDERRFKAELVETEPEDTTESLKKLGIKEIVASFSTPLTNDALRTENLRVAAKRVTGTLVKPGEQFDLYQVIGPIDASNGYHNAGVIVNGKHTDGMGGGLSQMSTTAYNAGFFAGMTDIAHRPHTVWIPRYPEGRESTLYVGSIDMIWQNDSKKGVLMRSYVADGKLTVEAWGTKTYKVTTSTSARSNVTPATMTTSTAADCEPYPTGQPGFSVTVFRKVTELTSGKVVKDEAKSWTYRPDNGVTCEKPEEKKDKKDD